MSSPLKNSELAWHSPDGTEATQNYLVTLRNAVIEWWLRCQRQDLPWRLRAIERQQDSHKELVKREEKMCNNHSHNNENMEFNILVAEGRFYDPYEVWVSEVMSQQTQLSTVVKYFYRWVKEFPNVNALARATEDEVRRVWSGMGYYRRALYLHKGAQIFVRDWSWNKNEPVRNVDNQEETENKGERYIYAERTQPKKLRKYKRSNEKSSPNVVADTRTCDNALEINKCISLWSQLTEKSLATECADNNLTNNCCCSFAVTDTECKEKHNNNSNVVNICKTGEVDSVIENTYGVTTTTTTTTSSNENNSTDCIDNICYPRTAREWQSIPGVGPYTAAAITSMCFNEPVIALDGNVVRVLSRVRGELEFDPKKAQNLKQAAMWGQWLMNGEVDEKGKCIQRQNATYNVADRAVEKNSQTVCDQPDHLNQGLMELGGAICKPAGEPLCSLCPLQSLCCAYLMKKQGEIKSIEGIIPLHSRSLQKRSVTVACVVHELSILNKGNVSSQKECHQNNSNDSIDDNNNISNNSNKNVHVEHNDSRNSYCVVIQRPKNGLLGGWLEFTSLSLKQNEDEQQSGSKFCFNEMESTLAKLSCGANVPSATEWSELVEESKEFENETHTRKRKRACSVGNNYPQMRYCGKVHHVFSHIDMTVYVFHVCWCIDNISHHSSAKQMSKHSNICCETEHKLRERESQEYEEEHRSLECVPQVQKLISRLTSAISHSTGESANEVKKRLQIVNRKFLEQQPTNRLMRKIMTLAFSKSQISTKCIKTKAKFV